MTETSPFVAAPLIIAVDDEPNILTALKRSLRSTGAEFMGFNSAAQALEHLPDLDPALIISDMRMPGMDGVEFLSKAKKIHPRTLRILLTGYTDYDKAMGALNEGGIWRHLSKPWVDSDLLQSVSHALELRSISMEKARLEMQVKAQRDELFALNEILELRVKERTEDLTVANSKLNNNFKTLVRVLSTIVDSRFSNGRTTRIAEISFAAAVQLNLPKHQCDQVSRAALLHLLGKIALPDKILHLAKDELSHEEILLFKSYPVNGADLLLPIEDLSPEAEIIQHHCERVDGLGFPLHLTDDNIPVGSRILAAAIAFDAALGSSPLTQHDAASSAAATIMKQADRRLCKKCCNAILAAYCLNPVGKVIEANFDRKIEGHQLKPNMTLARDVLAPSGNLLLVSGQKLTQTTIDQIMRFQDRQGLKIQFWIKTETGDIP